MRSTNIWNVKGDGRVLKQGAVIVYPTKHCKLPALIQLESYPSQSQYPYKPIQSAVVYCLNILPGSENALYQYLECEGGWWSVKTRGSYC